VAMSTDGQTISPLRVMVEISIPVTRIKFPYSRQTGDGNKFTNRGLYTQSCSLFPAHVLTYCAFRCSSMSSGVPSFKGPLPGGRLNFPDNIGTSIDATSSSRSPAGQHCRSTIGRLGVFSRTRRMSLRACCIEIMRCFLNFIRGQEM
jgi:hypothetical protein